MIDVDQQQGRIVPLRAPFQGGLGFGKKCFPVPNTRQGIALELLKDNPVLALQGEDLVAQGQDQDPENGDERHGQSEQGHACKLGPCSAVRAVRAADVAQQHQKRGQAKNECREFELHAIARQLSLKVLVHDQFR